MTVQFIVTSSGEEMAVLPRAAFEALVSNAEDAIDNAAADRIEAAFRAGEMETFPGDLVLALSNGANPVRAFREHRAMTVADLAGRAGVSRAYVTQIETGARVGSAATLRTLARALGVDMELLLPWE